MSPDEGVEILKKWQIVSQSLKLCENSPLGLPPCWHRVKIQSVDGLRLVFTLDDSSDTAAVDLAGAEFTSLTPGGIPDAPARLGITLSDGRSIAIVEASDQPLPLTKEQVRQKLKEYRLQNNFHLWQARVLQERREKAAKEKPDRDRP